KQPGEAAARQSSTSSRATEPLFSPGKPRQAAAHHGAQCPECRVGMTEASPAADGPTSRAQRWLGAALGVGAATAFNALVPGVGQIVPYMAFHLVRPGGVWFSRSLLVSWVAVLVAAVAGNVISVAPFWAPSLSGGAFGAGLAFI